MNKLSTCEHFKHAVTLYKTQHNTHNHSTVMTWWFNTW